MQIKLLREFYDDLRMDPSTIDYVEAHSTGTLVGDPEESHTLSEIFCKGRNGRPLPVGSVKSNMGHSEATSGLCSIAKVVIAFHNNLIPPNIHFVEPRADIPALVDGRLKVVADAQELMGPLVCVNSFGFGGGNAHALFRGSTKLKINHGIPADNLPRLVVWSGRTEEAVRSILDSVAKQQLDAEYVGLLHNIQTETFSSNIYRGYGIFTQSGSAENAKCVAQHMRKLAGGRRPLVWAYSGLGSHWCGMGVDLMKNKIFADSIENCHSILAKRGVNLKEVLTSSNPATFDNILHSIVGIVAVQIGFTDILKTVGITPDYIVGHSIGELSCAYADGCFTAEETVLAAYSVGMASLESQMLHGAMAVVGLSYKRLQTVTPDEIEIAHHNSADSCTISGPAAAVASFTARLRREGFSAKEIQCSNVPFHSKYSAGMQQNLIKRLSEFIQKPKKRSEKWISSSVAKANAPEAEYSSVKYHANNLTSSVFFKEACDLLPKNAMTVEIGPQVMLDTFLKASLPESTYASMSYRGNQRNSLVVLSAIGR